MLKKSATLTVICGPMFSGKTEELLRRIRRAQYGKKKVFVGKHSIDNRYEKKHIVSHLGDKISATLLKNEEELLSAIEQHTDIVAIDEIQFFDISIIPILIELRNKGIEIIISGLDLDFRGIPFGPIPYLLALADEIVKLKAVCFKTGKDAQYSQRLINGNPARHTDPIILVAAADSYQARAREAFEIDYIPLTEYLNDKVN
jgi:thymidine kinase